MPYTIREAVEDSQKRNVAYLALAERYPDAYQGQLPDGAAAWFSDSLLRPDATDFVLIAYCGDVMHRRGTVFLCPYVVVSGVRVFVSHWQRHRADLFLDRLKTTAPEFHARLLDLVRKSTP